MRPKCALSLQPRPGYHTYIMARLRRFASEIAPVRTDFFRGSGLGLPSDGAATMLCRLSVPEDRIDECCVQTS
jgi:hypothetical protein